MIIGEILRRFHQSTGVDNQPSNSEFSQIRNICLRANNIWSDRKDRKKERYQEAASKLLFHLKPEVLSNPQFYQEINWQTHREVLELLGRFVPSKPGEEFARFMESSACSTMVSYLQGILLHKVTITEQALSGLKVVVDGESSDYKEKVARYLYRFSDIPCHFLDVVYPRLGLPVIPQKSSTPFWYKTPPTDPTSEV